VLAADLLPLQNPKEFPLLLVGDADGGLRELWGESGARDPSNFVGERISVDCLLQWDARGHHPT